MTILWFFWLLSTLLFPFLYHTYRVHTTHTICAQKMGKSSIWPIICWSESIPLFLFEWYNHPPTFLYVSISNWRPNPATCGGTDGLNCRAPLLPSYTCACKRATTADWLTQVRTRRSRNMQRGGRGRKKAHCLRLGERRRRRKASIKSRLAQSLEVGGGGRESVVQQREEGTFDPWQMDAAGTGLPKSFLRCFCRARRITTSREEGR